MNSSFKYVPKYPVQTLGKALDILNYIKDNPSSEGISLTEISSALGIGKSGVHRLLDTLIAYDFVEKINSTSPAYRLGWGLFNAGNAVPKQHTLNGSSYTPIVEKLCNTFGETTNIGIMNNYETIIICKMEPARMLRTNTQVGEREPLYATALGKLFLSDFSTEEIDAYLEKTQLSKMAANTITNVDSLKLELDKIRSQNYAVDNEEFVDGMDVADKLGQDYEMTFKTLVTLGKSGNYYVYAIPVHRELDMKKAARAVGEKHVEMVPVKEINKVTGYIRGGCTPIGMKKQYTTVIHESAKQQDKIAVSGGRRGVQILLQPEDLAKASGATFADIIKEE